MLIAFYDSNFATTVFVFLIVTSFLHLASFVITLTILSSLFPIKTVHDKHSEHELF